MSLDDELAAACAAIPTDERRVVRRRHGRDWQWADGVVYASTAEAERAMEVLRRESPGEYSLAEIDALTYRPVGHPDRVD